MVFFYEGENQNFEALAWTDRDIRNLLKPIKVLTSLSSRRVEPIIDIRGH